MLHREQLTCAENLRAFTSTLGITGDCPFFTTGVDRDQSRRCNCMKYIDGTAPDGTRIRESTGTTSWEKARKILARKLAEHDPVNKPLFGIAADASRSEPAARMEKQSPRQSNNSWIPSALKNVVDMAHYEGFFKRELLVWCKEQGFFDVTELDLEQVTQFRNPLSNKGTVKNRKLSRLRSFSRVLQGPALDR